MDFNFDISILRRKERERERENISFFALEMFIDFRGYGKIRGRKQADRSVCTRGEESEKEKRRGLSWVGELIAYE